MNDIYLIKKDSSLSFSCYSIEQQKLYGSSPIFTQCISNNINNSDKQISNKKSIGIIDSGISKEYEYENIFIFDNNNNNKYDEHGHGTHIFGLIHQIVPYCNFYIAKVIDAAGYVDMNNIIKAIKWMIFKKVDIINISLLFKDMNEILFNEFTLVLNECKSKNIKVFLAGGNISEDDQLVDEYLRLINKHRPLPYEIWRDMNLVFVVGSYNYNTLEISDFSRTQVDVYIHGENLLSYHNKNNSFCFKSQTIKENDNFYSVASGTSQATAIGTGLYALYSNHEFTGAIENIELKLENPIKRWMKRKKLDYSKFGISQYDIIIQIEMLLFMNPHDFKLLSDDEIKKVEHLQFYWSFHKPICVPLKRKQINISLIDYILMNPTIYKDIYLIKVVKSFIDVPISRLAIDTIAKYWKTVSDEDYTNILNIENKMNSLKKSMGSLYPFTMDQKEFFNKLTDLIKNNKNSNKKLKIKN